MMLRLLLGSGGSGKTTAIYQAAAEKSRSGTGDCILLVPEQYSFETERRMLQLLGPKDGQWSAFGGWWIGSIVGAVNRQERCCPTAGAVFS